MKKILTLLLMLSWLVAFGQSPMTTDQVKINSSGSSKEWMLVYKPANYNPAKKYPTIVFFHGAGEAGTGESGLSKIYNSSSAGGPTYYIAHGQWPDSFYNYRDGKYYQFLVFAPQASSWSTDWKWVPYIMSDLVSRYSIDTSRIYFTGISAGGQTLWNYSAHYQVNPNYKAAAIVPMSAASNQTQSDAQFIVADSIRNWGFGDKSGDTWGTQTLNGVNYMNAIVPGIARFTNMPGSGHGGWGSRYTPTYRETIDGHNINIYEWMLWWDRDGSTESGQPGNQPPTVSAGSDKHLSAGTTSTTLTAVGNDVDGSIASYQWSKISGPSVTISNSTSATCSVSGLSDNNTYVFRVLVTDNGSLTATDDITVTVAQDLPPEVSAGNDQSITLPTNSVTLSGSATDDGSVSSTSWTVVSKPSGASPSITSASSMETMVTNLDSAGTYVFRMTATDNTSHQAHDDVTVTVSAQASGTAVAKFQMGPYGATKQEGYAYLLGNPSGKVLSSTQNGITLSTISTTQWHGLGGDTSRGATDVGKLTGNNSGVRPDNVLKYFFVCDGSYFGKNVSGVVQSYNLMLSGLNPFGFYTLKMGASRDASRSGSYAVGNVEYRVGSAIQGLDVTDNTANEATFSVQADASGNIMMSARPYQTSGTGTGNSSEGYIGWLEVIGTGVTHIPPTADAGKDSVYANGTTSVTLDGSGSTDSDGEIASYAWYKAGGDTGTVTISNPAIAQPTVSGLSNDTSYIFKLVVTDSDGLKDSDYVSITVGVPVVGDPVISAGYPQLLAQGNTSYTLTGTATVDGGAVSSVEWKQVYGPTVALSEVDNLTCPVTGLQDGGVYRFRLIVSNNVGVTDSQDVVIAVNEWYAGKKDTVIATTLPGYHLVNIDFSQTPYNKDTISILGGEYQYIQLKNLKGTASKRVVVRPMGGPVQLTSHVSGGTAGMLFSNCQYFHVDGEMQDTTYGFNLIGAERWGQINISGQSKCFEINNVYGHFMTYGFQIKNDPSCDPISWNDDEASTFVMDSIELHHFYFDSTIYEGTYIGGTLNTSKTSYPPHGGYRVACSGDTSYHFGYRIGHISIHDGTIKHTENDGIQLVDARYGKTEIYNMNIQDLGATGGGWQDHAMSIGGFQHVEVHDNYIHNAGFGIFMNGIESASIYNNTVVNVPNGPGLFIASATDTLYKVLTADSQIVRIYNNTIDSVQYGIQLTNYGKVMSRASKVYGNTITNASIAAFDHVNDPDVIWQGDYGGGTVDTSHGTNPWVIITSVDTAGSNMVIHAVTNSDLDIEYSVDGNTWSTDSVFTGLSQGWYIASARIDPAMRDNRNLVYISAADGHVNVAPVALAGDSVTLPFGSTSTNLLGNGSDPDGSIVSWAWNMVQGTGVIADRNAQNTPITGLKSDSLYLVRLVVTDDDGATGDDTLKIQVLGNIDPSVSAGTDIVLPPYTDATTLNSFASDADGSISSYAWTQVSGSAATITSPTAQATQVTGLQNGQEYVFRVTVTDNSGSTATDDVRVTVLRAGTLTFRYLRVIDGVSYLIFEDETTGRYYSMKIQ